MLICASYHGIYDQRWLITGCSSGLEETITYAALSRGDDVIETIERGIQRLRLTKKLRLQISNWMRRHCRQSLIGLLKKR